MRAHARPEKSREKRARTGTRIYTVCAGRTRISAVSGWDFDSASRLARVRQSGLAGIYTCEIGAYGSSSRVVIDRHYDAPRGAGGVGFSHVARVGCWATLRGDFRGSGGEWVLFLLGKWTFFKKAYG